ncbi:hypothetical protein BJ742DRAFT_809699 [Cladochytrium replicatum]|nr:hypothetical protein BJ742DRAFT_809699 [Cladochytrium replicatum]
MTYSPDEDEVSIGEGLTMTVKKTDRSAGAEEVDTLKEVTDVRLNSERVSMDTTTTISTSKETTAVVESGVSGSVKHSSAALYLLGESKELQTTSNTASVTASVTGDAALSDTSTLTTTVVESVTVEQSSSPTRLVEELVIGHAKPTTTTSVTEDGLAVEIRNVTEPADARSDRVEINAEDTTETNVTVESVEINSTGSTLKVHATEPVDVEKSTIGVTVTKNVTEDVTDVPTDVVTTLEEEKAHETAIVELTLTAVAEVESPVIDSAAVVENTVESSTLQIEDTEAREEIHVDASQVEIKKLGALSTAAASLESSTTEGHTVRKGSNGSAVVYEDVIDEGKIVSYAHEPGIFMENGDEVEYRWEVLLSGERVMRRIVRRRVIRTTTTTTTTTTRRTSMAGAGADEDGEVEIKEEIGPEGQKIVRRIIRRKVTRVVPGENTFTSVSGSSSTTDGGEDVEVREEIGPDGQKIIRRIIKRRIVKEASLTDTGSATGSVNGEDEVETKEDVGPDGRKIIRRIIKRKVVKEVPAESETVSMSSSSGAVRETNGDDEVEVKEEVGPDGQKFIRRIIRKKVVTRAPAETREATFSVTDLGSQHGNGSTSVSSATQVKATSTGTGTDDDVEVKEEIGPDGRTIIRRIIKKRVVIQVPESATTASTTSGDGEDDVEIKEIGPDGRKIIRRIITRRVVTASPQSIVSEGEAGASSSTSSTFASTEVAGADGEEVETTEETLPDGQRVVRKLIKRRAVQRATPEQVATSVARTADAGGNETVEVREEVGPDGTKIVRRIVKRRSIVRGSSATTASPQSPTRE